VENGDKTPTPKTLAATLSMCYHCFDTLIEKLQRGSPHKDGNAKPAGDATAIPNFVDELQDASVECPIFVTWEKRKNNVVGTNHDDSTWQLRGCIGTLGPRLLATAVGEFALTSALRDHRFNPVQILEVSSLRVSVSLLVDYEECKDVYDWSIGVHGILIKFTVKGHHYSATYLPEVAKQQRWDHSKTLSSLIHKAGCNENVTNDLLTSIHCTRYQSSKSQVTFDEYVLHHCQGKPPISRVRPLSWSPCNSM
jgi:AMME syndrome candidate gene 1 protein